MQLVKFISIALVAGAALTGSASAQQRSTTPAPLRGYLIIGGGASVEPNRSTTVSAEIAENLSRNLQVYANASFYDNLMTDVARDQLVAVADALTVATGAPWQFSGRDRGRSFTFGARYLLASAGRFRPYIGTGLGVLNLRRTIIERSRGDLTDSFHEQFGSVDGVLDVTQTNTNRPMAEVAGGVGVVIRRGYVDFGYRFRKAFHAGQSFNVSNVSVLAGVKF